MTKSTMSRRDLFKFGGVAAMGVAAAGALAGCGQPKLAGTGDAAGASGDGSTYMGPSFLNKPAEITDFAEEHTYDVVVVGAGESGLAAEPVHRADRRQHGRLHRSDQDE